MLIWARPETSKVGLGGAHAGINFGLKVATALLMVFAAALILLGLEAHFRLPMTTEDFINIFF